MKGINLSIIEVCVDRNFDINSSFKGYIEGALQSGEIIG